MAEMIVEKELYEPPFWRSSCIAFSLSTLAITTAPSSPPSPRSGTLSFRPPPRASNTLEVETKAVSSGIVSTVSFFLIICFIFFDIIDVVRDGRIKLFGRTTPRLSFSLMMPSLPSSRLFA